MNTGGLQHRDTLVGQILFGEYAVLDVMGEGSLGKLYKAKHLTSDRLVAMKTLRVLKSTVLDKYIAAIEQHMKLEHPYIVESYGLKRTELGRPYYITQLVEGTSLKELLEKTGRLEKEEDVIELARQLCEALEYAHEKGVLHLSLRPSQVLFTETNGELTTKLTDFAIEKVRVDVESMTGEFGVVDNLIHYSPEYLDFEYNIDEYADPRADVYSLALMTFHMLTGELPFRGRTPGERLAARKQTDAKPIAVEEIRPDVKCPELFNELMRKSLASDPDCRIGTVAEFHSLLDEWREAVLKEREIEKEKERALIASGARRRKKRKVNDLKKSVHDMVSLKRTQQAQEDTLMMKLANSVASEGPRRSPEKILLGLIASIAISSAAFFGAASFLAIHQRQLQGLWISASIELSKMIGISKEGRAKQMVQSKPSRTSPLVKEPEKVHHPRQAAPSLSGQSLGPGDEWPRDMLLRDVPYNPKADPSYGITNNMRSGQSARTAR